MKGLRGVSRKKRLLFLKKKKQKEVCFFEFGGERALAVAEDALALQREFRSRPVGAYSPALARLLSHMRAMPIEGKLCLICLKPFEAYAIARMSAARGVPPTLVDNRVFSTAADAEWEIFKARWHALFGEKIDEEAL